MPSKVVETTPGSGSGFKESPLKQLRILYVAFCKGLFSAAPVGSYHWSEGDDTEIYISDEYPIHAESVGQRPAISFSRGPVQFYSLGMDDMMGYDQRTGQKRKGVLIPGTMTIHCASRNDLESEYIAWVVAEHLWLLRERLLRQGFFEIGRQFVLQAPSPAGSVVSNDHGEEWYVTSVSSPFQFPRMSQFTPLNTEVINSIQLQIRSARQQIMGCGPSAPSHQYMVDEHACKPEAFAQNASDAHGRTPDPAGLLPSPPPLQPHPLNPAVKVVVRSSCPYKPALKPPSIAGRPIPIADPCVEQSESGILTVTSTVKV